MRRVLVLPSFYPTAQRPRTGTFFVEHVRMMRAAHWCADVVFVEPRSLRDLALSALVENHFQSTVVDEPNGCTCRVHGWNPIAQTFAGGMTSARLLAWAVDRYIRQRGAPALIHAHNALWGGEAARVIAARHRIPYVVTEHSSAVLMGELSRREAAQARTIWTAAAATTAVGQRLAASMRTLGVSAVDVTPNPVDTEFFTLPPDAARAPGERRFLAVANLNANKRIDLLLRAFARVADVDSSAQLRVIGDGPMRRELGHIANSLHVATRVHFSGATDRDEIRSAMWWATCFVSASRFETFGIAVAEALATGLPVVSTRSGGPDEIVVDGTGVLVPADSEDELVQAMLAVPTSVSAGPDAAARRATIVSRYSPAVVADMYTQLYNRATARRP